MEFKAEQNSGGVCSLPLEFATVSRKSVIQGGYEDISLQLMMLKHGTILRFDH